MPAPQSAALYYTGSTCRGAPLGVPPLPPRLPSALQLPALPLPQAQQRPTQPQHQLLQQQQRPPLLQQQLQQQQQGRQPLPPPVSVLRLTERQEVGHGPISATCPLSSHGSWSSGDSCASSSSCEQSLPLLQLRSRSSGSSSRSSYSGSPPASPVTSRWLPAPGSGGVSSFSVAHGAPQAHGDGLRCRRTSSSSAGGACDTGAGAAAAAAAAMRALAADAAAAGAGARLPRRLSPEIQPSEVEMQQVQLAQLQQQQLLRRRRPPPPNPLECWSQCWAGGPPHPRHAAQAAAAAAPSCRAGGAAGSGAPPPARARRQPPHADTTLNRSWAESWSGGPMVAPARPRGADDGDDGVVGWWVLGGLAVGAAMGGGTVAAVYAVLGYVIKAALTAGLAWKAAAGVAAAEGVVLGSWSCRSVRRQAKRAAAARAELEAARERHSRELATLQGLLRLGEARHREEAAASEEARAQLEKLAGSLRSENLGLQRTVERAALERAAAESAAAAGAAAAAAGGDGGAGVAAAPMDLGALLQGQHALMALLLEVREDVMGLVSDVMPAPAPADAQQLLAVAVGAAAAHASRAQAAHAAEARLDEPHLPAELDPVALDAAQAAAGVRQAAALPAASTTPAAVQKAVAGAASLLAPAGAQEAGEPGATAAPAAAVTATLPAPGRGASGAAAVQAGVERIGAGGAERVTGASSPAPAAAGVLGGVTGPGLVRATALPAHASLCAGGGAGGVHRMSVRGGVSAAMLMAVQDALL